MAGTILYPECWLIPEVETPPNPLTYAVCHIHYRCNTWVKLFQSPRRATPKMAQLLCQESTTTWIAWIADYGEVVLDRSQFYA